MESIVVNNYSEFYKYYDYISNLERRKKFADYIAELISEVANSNNRILDIGCGTGNVLLYLSNYDFDIIGLDNSEEMLSIAKQKIKSIKNISIMKSDMSDFIIKPAVSVAFCTSFSLTYLLSEEKVLSALTSAYNSLINGGFLLIDMLHPQNLSGYFNVQKTRIIEDIEITTKLTDYESSKGNYTVEYIFSSKNVIKKEIHRGRAISIENMVSIAKKAGFVDIRKSKRNTDYVYELLCIK